MSWLIVLHGDEMEAFEKLANIHPPQKCEGQICIIHNPAEGPWRRLPLGWRSDQRIFERHCKDGVGHPDPSQFPYWESISEGWRSTHGCDGCCRSWPAYLKVKILEA